MTQDERLLFLIKELQNEDTYFSFPNTRAAQIATATVMDWLKENDYDIKVVFNVFKDIDFELYEMADDIGPGLF